MKHPSTAFGTVKANQYVSLFFLISLLFVVQSFANAQNYYYEMGKEAFDKGEYETAKNYLDKELDEHSKNSRAYMLRSIINQFNGDKVNALSDINNAISNCAAKEKIAMGFMYKIQGDIYKETEDYENAMNAYNMAINKDKNKADYFIDRSKVFEQTGNFEKAIADLDIALKIDDSKTKAIGSKAFLLILLDRDNEAEAILNKRLLMDPEFDYGYQLKAFIEHRRHNNIQAIDEIFNAFKYNGGSETIRGDFMNYTDSNINYTLNKLNTKVHESPDQPRWLEMRARINAKKLNYVQSIADVNRCLDLTVPDGRTFYLNLRATDYFELGKYDDAIRDFSEIKDSRTNNSWDYYMIGETNKRKGDYATALKNYDSSILVFPTEPYYFFKRAYLKYKFLNDNTGAAEDFKMAMDMDKNLDYLNQGYAEFLELTHFDDNALKATWERLNIQDSVFKNDWNYRPFALYYLGFKDEAIACQEQRSAQSTGQNAFLDEARFYALLGDEAKCIAAMKKAINKGSAIFYELENYYELEAFIKRPAVAKFISEQKAAFRKQNESLFVENHDETTIVTKTISMKPRGSGTYEVSCKVNDLSLNFIFDTGASDISISQTEAQFMLKNGYLSNNDIIGTQKYTDANGDIEVGTKIMLKSVDFGGLVLKNVAASVVNNKKAPLLFGQSALSKYGKIEINNKNNTVTITQTERK